MTNDPGFARAQAQYDAQMPPEPDECPVCDGAEFDEDKQNCPHGYYGGQTGDDLDDEYERADRAWEQRETHNDERMD